MTVHIYMGAHLRLRMNAPATAERFHMVTVVLKLHSDAQRYNS